MQSSTVRDRTELMNWNRVSGCGYLNLVIWNWLSESGYLDLSGQEGSHVSLGAPLGIVIGRFFLLNRETARFFLPASDDEGEERGERKRIII